MKNFCTECGRKLEAGKECVCKTGAIGDATPQVEAAPQIDTVTLMESAPKGYVAPKTEEVSQAEAPQPIQPEEKVQPSQGQQQAQQEQVQQQQQQPVQQQYNQQQQPVQQPYNQQYQQPNQQQYQQPNQQQYQQPNQQQYNQQYQQPNQQQYNQQPYNGQRTKEAEWMSQQTTRVVSGAKNMFAEIGPLLKNPITKTRELAAQNSPTGGIVFMAIKVLLCAILITTMVSQLLKSAMGGFGGWGDFVDMEKMFYEQLGTSKFKIIVTIIILFALAEVLGALAYKLISGLFGIKITANEMITVAGTRAMFECLFLIVAFVFSFMSVKIGYYVILGMTMLTTYMQYACYSSVAKDNDDKKPYAYAIATALVAIIMTFIVVEVLKGMMAPMMEELGNALEMFS